MESEHTLVKTVPVFRVDLLKPRYCEMGIIVNVLITLHIVRCHSSGMEHKAASH